MKRKLPRCIKGNLVEDVAAPALHVSAPTLTLHEEGVKLELGVFGPRVDVLYQTLDDEVPEVVRVVPWRSN